MAGKRDNSIQYTGEPGVTAPCLDSVVHMLQLGERISKCRILSHGNSHSLFLTAGEDEHTAVKSGFRSGYSGEGPRGFSYALHALEAHGAEIDELRVEEPVMQRLDESSLRESDIKRIKTDRPIRPSEWYGYFHEAHTTQVDEGKLWQDFPIVMPFSIIDPTIADLAVRFFDSPDECLMTAYRRLEDKVRERTQSLAHGSKLFSEAFHGSSAPLQWPNVDGGEQAGRANLFTGTYGAYRNPRAHRETNNSAEEQLIEFLAVNQLFRLEREAEQMSTSAE